MPAKTKLKEKTAKQVQSEITKLKQLKPIIRHYSAFGDNNRDKVQVQIDALVEDWSEDDAYDKEDAGDLTVDECSNALEAIHWRSGEIDDVPSDNWKPLILK